MPAFRARPITPRVVRHDPAGEHGPIGLDPLPDDSQAEAVEADEGVRSGTAKAASSTSVSFRWAGSGTSIVGRPQPTPGQRRADATDPATTPLTAKSSEAILVVFGVRSSASLPPAQAAGRKAHHSAVVTSSCRGLPGALIAQVR